MTENFFNVGSLNYLIVEASKVEDILYVMWDKKESTFKIIVKPGYNIDAITDFKYHHVPIHVYCEVIVEQNYESLKQGD